MMGKEEKPVLLQKLKKWIEATTIRLDPDQKSLESPIIYSSHWQNLIKYIVLYQISRGQQFSHLLFHISSTGLAHKLLVFCIHVLT